MKILIDGDACQVVDITEKVASKKKVDCWIYCDTSRIIDSEYSEIHIVDRGNDAVDFAIVNNCNENDIVITNDSGLAAMVLVKKAYALNSRGFEYSKKNISSFLNRRHIRMKQIQRTNNRYIKGELPAGVKTMNYKHLLELVVKRALKQENESSGAGNGAYAYNS